MTLKELIMSTEYRKKGLAYQIWKTGLLSQMLKEFPETPEEANPELYPPKPTIAKPSCLKHGKLKNKGGIMTYE